MKHRAVGEEWKGASLVKRWYTDGHPSRVEEEVVEGQRTLSFVDWLRDGFLPQGFPHSTTEDYLDFQLWDSTQALCSYVRGMLTSQAILAGIGVGEEAATPLAAVFNFFVRDFTAMLGGVLFAFCQGSDLDGHAKQWRLFADCFNNVGYALDLASPLFPGAFLALACLGGVARSITGVAGGATRAALTQHFARSGNAADISAKEGSQETATTLVGMLAGMALLKAAAGSHVVIWAAFLVLTALHIYANVRAMRALCLKTLNCARMDVLLEHQLMHQSGQSVPDPWEVAKVEPLAPPVLLRWWRWLRGRPAGVLVMGGRLSELGVEGKLASMDADALAARHIVGLSRARRRALVVLRADAKAEDVLAAYVHGYMLLHSSAPMEACWAEVDAWMQEGWPKFRAHLERAGWVLHPTALCASPWRGAWGDALHEHSM